MHEQEEQSRISAREAFERRQKEPHARRTKPQEVIASDGEGITLVPHHVLRFWRKVEKSESGCWEWVGSKWNNGYGRFMVEKRRRKAHRISFLLRNGILPSDKIVCHKCDNPSCVNPDHLFLGTVDDNSKDMVSKGRSTHGERNGRSILRESDVREIRSINPTSQQCRELASKFGCHPNAIKQVVKKETWTRI